MKKKILIPVMVVCLLIVGVAVAFLLRGAHITNDAEYSSEQEQKLLKTIEINAENTFDFLKSKKTMPDNMRGYFVDPEKDIDISDSFEEKIKASVESVFEKVNAVKPNTIAVMLKENEKYEINGFNYVAYLSETAHKNNMTVILSLGSDYKIEKVKSDTLLGLAEKYGGDAVMLDAESINGEASKSAAKIRTELNEKNIFFGIALNEKLDGNAAKEIESGNADFYFARINSSSETGAEKVVADWSKAAVGSKAKIYAVLRNDLVCSGKGYTKQNEINEQLRLLYNYGIFSGALMSDRAKLAANENDTAINLYSYYEYFGNVKYTALTLTDFSIKDNSTAVFSGESDTKYPVYVRSTASDTWTAVKQTGENGLFTAEIPLTVGENKLIVRHKNALYTYYIDKAVDVLTDCGAQVSGDKITLNATAYKGSRVWASLANSKTVELEATGEESNGYAVYGGTFDLKNEYKNLKNDMVSFAAELGGLCDTVMCGEEKTVSPYNDNGLGRANICIVTKNYAETTATSSEDDSSDPTCTPQLAGTITEVEKVSVSDNHLIYYSSSGMKIYGEDSRLILDGFVMPDNSVTLNSVSEQGGTLLDFSVRYPSFTRVMIEPQEYHKGFLERIYNVDSFQAEYIDILFNDTNICYSGENIDFSSSEIIDRCEWYSNKEDNFITLRLYLKSKGVFSGYSLYKDDDGHIKLLFKNNKKSLSGAVIMLDPGHGGYGSPGTNVGMKIYEKDITLAVAEAAAELLRENGATVILTREGDDAVFMDERVALARREKPDVFVSIHCDGADNPSWLGTHTFYYKNFSMPLADAIHKQVVGAYRSYYYTDPNSDAYKNVDKKIKFFPYQVTRIEECPSVLVECGYLSNEYDAKFLCDKNGQKIIATAIAQGIVDYIVNY